MAVTPAHAAIAVTGLRKSYGNTVVLDGIDLRITERAKIALLGPNGAGMTTLCGLRMDKAAFTSARFDRAALNGVMFRGTMVYGMCPSALGARSIALPSARWPSMGRERTN